MEIDWNVGEFFFITGVWVVYIVMTAARWRQSSYNNVRVKVDVFCSLLKIYFRSNSCSLTWFVFD